LYLDLVAIGILFGYGIKAILIPIFVICEQDIPKKKKKRKEKKRKRPKDAHQKRPKLPILFFGPWRIIYIWHLWYCFKPMPVLAHSWLIYFGICGIV
jgi:hypothetical protein